MEHDREADAVTACSKCGRATSREEGFPVDEALYCRDCFLGAASARPQLTAEQKKNLKRAVQEELAGLLPRTALEEALEHGYGELLKGADFDETMNWTINKIEQVAGLAMSSHILDIVASLKKELSAQEDEIRERMKRLGGL